MKINIQNNYFFKTKPYIDWETYFQPESDHI